MCVCVCVDCRFPQVQFEYNDPSANFDRRRVRGPVVRLMTVREREAATALEVTAGGRVRREEGGEVCVLKSEGIGREMALKPSTYWYGS